MRSKLAIIAIIMGLGLVGAGCSGSPAKGPAPSPQTKTNSFAAAVTLSVGSSATYSDGLKVTLKTINDSRCAPGNTCIWQGELSPMLVVSGGELTAESDITLGTERAKAGVAGPYTFTLDGATEASATLTVIKKTQ